MQSKFCLTLREALMAEDMTLSLDLQQIQTLMLAELLMFTIVHQAEVHSPLTLIKEQRTLQKRLRMNTAITLAYRTTLKEAVLSA